MNALAHVDIREVASLAAQQGDRILSAWLPDGKRQAGEWIARNPTRNDHKAGSLSVDVATGKGGDFATGDTWGDYVGMVAALEGVNQGEAARRLADFLGGEALPSPVWRGNGTGHAKVSTGPENRPQAQESPLLPIPDDAPPLPAHPRHGKPSAVWTYRNREGQPIMHVCRFDYADDSKDILPLTYWPDGWRWKGLPAPRPLYGLDRLAARPDTPVIVCEGEKAADACGRMVPSAVAVTSPNGSKAADKADWSPLAGRRVLVWPDRDEPGTGYALDVRRLALAAGAANVRILDVAAMYPDAPAGFDAADLEAEGGEWNKDDLQFLPDAVEAPQSTQAAEWISTPSASPAVGYRRLSDIQAKPIRWLWNGRFARGKVSMLAGNPGLGKSQITASMAAIVSTGGTWPVDRTRCERGSVVFLSAEDDAEDTIRPRLEAAGADLDRCYILDAVIEGYRADGGEVRRSFSLKNDLARLGGLLAEIGDVALIVIDPVTAYLGDTDSHKNSDIRALLSPLGELATKHGAAVVCVSHLNKGGSGEALMRVTGSLAFVAAARAAFLVAKDKDDDARRLFLPIKNNIGNDQSGLAFAVHSATVDSPAGRIDTSRVVWEAEAVTITADEAMAPVADPEERSAVEEAKDFLRGLLADGPVPVKQIRADADGAGHAWRTIQRAQKTLGIDAMKEGGNFGGGKQYWAWKLPDREQAESPLEDLKDAKNSEDRHTNNVDTFRKVGNLQSFSGGEAETEEGVEL